MRSRYAGRQVLINLPNRELLEEWQKRAAEGNLSLTCFILQAVEAYGSEKPATTGNPEEVKALNNEISRLKVELDQIKRLSERQTDTFQTSTRLTDMLPKPFDKAVKTALQKGGIWNGKRLTKELGMYFDFPAPGLGEDLRSLNKVLQGLIDRGLVEEVERGFRWIK